MATATTQPTSGFRDFTAGLKEANRAIEDKLDTLNTTMKAALAAPRSLHVSSRTPVTDTGKILADITYNNVVNSGLG